MLTGEIGNRVRELVREICSTNYADIISGSVSPDHVHILVSIPPSIAVSKLVQYIKGKSSRKLMQEFRNLGKRYWGQHIWARGYFAVTVGNLNQQQAQEYIESQGQHNTNHNDNFSVTES